MIEKETPAGGNGLGQIEETSLYQQYTDPQLPCQSLPVAVQRARILEMRVCELRKQGHRITTDRVDEYCPGGVRHRVARYRLEAGETGHD